MKTAPKLLIVLPQHCYINSEGVWTTELYDASMWNECLDSWEMVTIAALGQQAEPPQSATRVDGPGIDFKPLKFSRGYYGALMAIPARLRQLRAIVPNHDALVLHTPSDLGALACWWARWYGIPYGLDVRGDQSVNVQYLRERGDPLARISAGVFRGLFAWVRARAVSAIYVSRELSERFPLSGGRSMSVYSDVRIPKEWFAAPRDYLDRRPPWKICAVGRIEAQKGYTYLLEACARVAQSNRNLFTLEIVGKGPLEEELRGQAKTLGISDLVRLRGFVPWGSELLKILQSSDLFVLPSITEGMPRAAIEAMACGLPVIASAVGGVPEILSSEYLVPPTNIQALTDALLKALQSPQQLTQMSQINCQRAAAFYPDYVRAGKQAFYRSLRLAAENSKRVKQFEQG